MGDRAFERSGIGENDRILGRNPFNYRLEQNDTDLLKRNSPNGFASTHQ